MTIQLRVVSSASLKIIFSSPIDSYVMSVDKQIKAAAQAGRAVILTSLPSFPAGSL
jgi:hypothetical protein